MALTRAMARFEGHALHHEQAGSPARARMWRQVQYWVFVDVMTVQALVGLAGCALLILRDEMHVLNLQLEPTKCKCYVPILSETPRHLWPEHLREV